MSPSRFRIAAALAVPVVIAATIAVVPLVTQAVSTPPAKGRAAAALATAPLAFEANQGQTDPTVSFLARTPGGALFLTPGELVMRLGKGGDVLRSRFVGANAHPTMEGRDLSEAPINYFHGPDPAQWATSVPSFAKVIEHGVYPGIDLVHYGNNSQYEFDVVVAPSADPAVAALAFDGASAIRLDATGDLLVTLPGGDVRHTKPAVYQEISGRRVAVDGAYQLRPDSTVGFQVGAYDRTAPLVIDPVVYSKFVGGSEGFDDYAFDVAADSNGNTYVTGRTRDTDFPQVNPQDTKDAQNDAFVYKLDPTGTTLIYSTYLSAGVFGRSGNDEGRAIAVDGDGNAYATGTVTGTDFPTTPGALGGPEPHPGEGTTTSGSSTFSTNSAIFTATDVGRPITGTNIPADTTIASFTSPTSVELSDVATATGTNLNFTLLPKPRGSFATKLDSSGNLVYSTYLPNPGSGTFARGIAVDGGGHAFVGGAVLGDTFNDEFALELNPTGTGLVYYTQIGAPGLAEGWDIAIDGTGNAYLLGETDSSTFPVTGNAYDATVSGTDLTVVRLDPAGAVTYSSFFGGSGSESHGFGGMGIAVDGAARVYVTSPSDSPDVPGTSGRYQPALAGGSDVIVVKLDLTLAPASQLLWATYLGGAGNDGGSRITVDGTGSSYVAGITESSDFPTASPVQGVFGGPSDGFAVKLNPAATGLVWSTYLGGNGIEDNGLGVAIDPARNMYVSGGSTSTDFPSPPGAAPPALLGSNDTFVVKLTASPTPRATDFNANGTNEVAVFRPNGGTWFAHDSIGADTTQQWGVVGDAPVTGDFDGDGLSDTAIYRPSTALWAIHSSSGGGNTFVTYGTTGDIPVPADYDGDGRADIAIYRPSLGTWFVHRSSDSTDAIATFGALNSDIAVPGDYDGDGRADLGIYRDGTWFIHTATNVDASANWGTTGDIPVAADYDGDGAADFAIYRPSTGLWAVRGTAGTNTFVTYGGIAGDVPVAADYDRDGKADIAIFRPPSGGWFVHRSSDNTDAISTWGVPTDIPLPLPIAVWSRFYP